MAATSLPLTCEPFQLEMLFERDLTGLDVESLWQVIPFCSLNKGRELLALSYTYYSGYLQYR